MQKWLQKVRRGYVLRGGPAQPPAISPDHLQKVVQIAQDSPFDLTAEDFTERLLDAKRATENEVNKASKGIDGLSRTTIRNYAKKANMKECFAEVATASRVIATTDVYNFVAFAAMNKFMVHSKGINQLLIMNAGGKADHRVKVFRCTISSRAGKSLKARQKLKSSEGCVSYFIKYYLLISAGGIQADPIYILADENMGADEFRVVTIPGLGVGTNLNNQEPVVFCKTRIASGSLNSRLFHS